MTLTKQEAILRSNSIKPNMNYEFYFCLQKGITYSGVTRITFELLSTSDIFLDFTGKAVLKFKINDSPEVECEDQIKDFWKNGKLQLPQQSLQIGTNLIVVHFSNEYNKDGNGLHSFVDNDEKQYIYTQSEPYWHHRVVPIFDQPDLKGHVTYHFLYPNDWVVVCNSQVDKEFPDHLDYIANDSPKSSFEKLILQNYSDSDFQAPDQSFSIFRQTVPISTYLFCFIAGCYLKYDPSPELQSETTPMSLYCRKSKFSYAKNQAPIMFEVLVKGIEFFENYFGQKFPYDKWDFVFCPEYTIGAMEHPGCVTFNDSSYIFSG